MDKMCFTTIIDDTSRSLPVYVTNEARPSDKWGNSFSRISWVTRGNQEKLCLGSASGEFIAYAMLLYNLFFFSMLIVFL